MGQNIAGEALMELGGVLLHGVEDVQQHRVFLIADLDGPGGLDGGHFVLCHDHGHIVAVVPDPAV